MASAGAGMTPPVDESALLPLNGVRVLDLTRLLPGNVCTLALAMLGAEVIKVEDTEAGDYMRGFGKQVADAGVCHQDVNRGKLSVTIDLKSEVGRRRLEALVCTADVLVESFRPGVMDRLGFSADRLHELAPHLVVASISGYGATGPLSQQVGHDLNYLAFTGVLDRLQAGDGKSVLPALPLVDLIGGGILPAMLIVAYVHRARRDGKGAWIDASMAEGIALLPHVLLNDILNGIEPDGPRDSLLGGGLACYDTYLLRDGQVAVAALESRFWKTICDVVDGLDAYREEHHRREWQPAIRARLTEYFAQLSRDDVDKQFVDKDSCVSVVQSYEEMLTSPQAVERQFVIKDPAIAVPVLAFPAMVDGKRLPERGPAPAQGEHNELVFRGLDDESC